MVEKKFEAPEWFSAKKNINIKVLLKLTPSSIVLSSPPVKSRSPAYWFGTKEVLKFLSQIWSGNWDGKRGQSGQYSHLTWSCRLYTELSFESEFEKETWKAGLVSKTEKQILYSVFSKSAEASGSGRSFVRASTLPLSKVWQLSHWITSYTRFTKLIQKYRQAKAFARFVNEICCMDLAFVVKISKDNNDIKYLLVCGKLFDRTMDAKRMKTIVEIENVFPLQEAMCSYNKTRVSPYDPTKLAIHSMQKLIFYQIVARISKRLFFPWHCALH